MDSRRIPPQNLEAESSVLGGLLLDQDAWDEVSDLITEKDFYKPAHQKVFVAIRELKRRNEATDLITVSNYLMSTKELEPIGGPGYLADLMDKTPSAANIVNYAKIVHEKYLLRQVIKISQTTSEKAFSQDFESVPAFLDECEAKMFSLSDQKQMQGLVASGDLIKLSLEKLEELHAMKGQLTGVPSGFTTMDDMTAGFQPGEITILAARPSMGKTALSLNIAMHAALREKKSVAYFSVEMAKESVMMRMLAIEAKVRLSDMRIGALDNKSWSRLINTAATISQAKMFIDDTSGISPFEIRSKARRLKAKHGLDMIMIDYLQLMNLKQKVESREREVSQISSTLKAIAKELRVPVIALAQLNRGVEGRSDRRPMLSDLRESGSIEQDADIIMMLYREDYYDRDNPEIKGISEVIIGKQRNGPTGTVKLRWIAEYGIFANYTENQTGPTPPPPSQAPPGMSSQNKEKKKAPSAGAPQNFAPKGM